MHRASRYRLYPNQTQERQFVQLCGAGRFVYNELLAEQKREYARSRPARETGRALPGLTSGGGMRA